MANITKEQLKTLLTELLDVVHQKNDKIVTLYNLLKAEMAANVASTQREQQAETALAQTQTDRDDFKAQLDALKTDDEHSDSDLGDLVQKLKEEAEKPTPEIDPAPPAPETPVASQTGAVGAPVAGIPTDLSATPDTSSVDLSQPVVTGGTPGVAVTPSAAPGQTPGLANPAAIIPGIPTVATPGTTAPATVVETAANPDNIVSA